MQETHNYGKKSYKKKDMQMKCYVIINNQIVLQILTQIGLEKADFIE